MGKPGFSDDEIVSAGRELLASGKAVTPYALQKILGGGNADRLISVWERRVMADDPTSAQEKLPAAIEGRVQACMSEIERVINTLAAAGWRDQRDAALTAQCLVEQKLRAALEQQAHEERQILQDLESCQNQIDAFVNAKDPLTVENTALRKEAAKLELELADAHVAHDVTSRQLEFIHQALTETKENHRVQEEHCRAEVRSIQDRWDHDRRNLARLEGEVQTLRDINDRLLGLTVTAFPSLEQTASELCVNKAVEDEASGAGVTEELAESLSDADEIPSALPSATGFVSVAFDD